MLRPAAHFYWKLKNTLTTYPGARSKHIIICGYPRSGTSLIYNMISASIKGFQCEEFEMEAIRRLHRSGNYVTKFPLDVLNIDEILDANVLGKEIFLVILTRDVRDLITSRHPNIPDRYFIGYTNSWWPQNPQFTEWKYDAPGIEAIYAAIQHCSSRSNLNVLKVHYEELVHDANSVQKQIASFTDTRFSGLFTDFHERKDKHAYRYTGRHQAKDETLVRENIQVDTTRISKWKDPAHAQIVFDQFSLYPKLFEILINEGYEKDNHWFHEIEDSINKGATEECPSGQ